MTLYRYVSVHEYTSGPKEGQRFLMFGKRDESGTDILLPKPDNDIETMESMDRERILVYEIPEEMSKSELKAWLEENEPDEVWDVLTGDES